MSFSSSKDATRPSDLSLPVTSQDATEQGKPLLISYVRAEAFEHALNLKRCLTDLGFSVYLVRGGFYHIHIISINPY